MQCVFGNSQMKSIPNVVSLQCLNQTMSTHRHYSPEWRLFPNPTQESERTPCLPHADEGRNLH